MLLVTIDVENADLWGKRLGIMGDALKDLTPVWTAWAIDFHAKERFLFEVEGAAPGFRAWTPLSPRYAAQKRRAGYAGGILVRTGRLRASLTGGSADSITRIKPQDLEVGTRVPYAKYHQGGTRKMPARPPLRVTAAQKRFLLQLIQRFAVNKGLRDGTGAAREHA